MKRTAWLWTTGTVIGMLVVSVFWGTRVVTRDLPPQAQIRETILDRYPIRPNATWVPLHHISPKLQQAVITWEDPTFYFHNGFNWTEIGRSIVRNIKARAYIRGGSTITQQVAKNMYLSPEKTLLRKLREAVLTARIESVLNKKEILEIYLNVVEWGPRIAGAYESARWHFQTSATDLTWGEAALLTGMLQNPARFNPKNSPERARKQQLRVLEKLLHNNVISRSEYQKALKTRI